MAAVLRVIAARGGLFADEMSTYWIITAHRAGAGLPALHGLGGVIALVGHVYPGGDTAEITPPLYFMAAWLTTQLGHSPELVRAPSILAGIASIPMMYLLGLRVVDRAAGIVAAALTALSPFMIFYSSEARAYSLMMFLLLLSTLAMLLALDTRRTRWWVLYAVASAGAVYSHYTSVFVLAAQALWLLWAHPDARKPAIMANVGALVLFAPWIPGAINEFSSPTVKILSALSPFTWTYAKLSFEHWLVGFPYSTVGLGALPGRAALVMLGLATIITLASFALTIRRRRSSNVPLARLDRRLVLVVVLAASVPVGETIVSSVGTHVFGGRDFAASTAGAYLLAAALLTATGPRLRYIAGALVIVAFAIGAAKMTQPQYGRPDIQGGAKFVERNFRPGDVVIDETAAFSPGPLSSLDTVLPKGIPVIRAGSPDERDHPFGFFDPVVRLSAAVPQAIAAARGNRIFVVANSFGRALLAQVDNAKLVGGTAAEQKFFPQSGGEAPGHNPVARGYRVLASSSYPGFPGVKVQLYGTGAAPRR